jgi:hypothetical protein
LSKLAGPVINAEAAANNRAIATLAAVRRIVLILLMVLLPLQSTWAAAASACPHERVSAGKHTADAAHERGHEHAGIAAIAAIADDGSTNSDNGRGSAAGSTCHGQGNAAVIAHKLVALTPVAAGIVPTAYARFVADCFLESPLRPPVLHLA